MNSRVFLLFMLFLVFVLSGCGKTTPDNSVVLVEVDKDTITLNDLKKNPGFKQMLDQYILDKIIRQEFKARDLVLSKERVDEEWQNFVNARGGGEESNLLEQMKAQGITKDYMIAQMEMQIMLQEIINSEFPITLEDARKDFESNLSANQRMYANRVPEKKDNPETITFEDVSEEVFENMKRRNFQMESQNIIASLKEEYNNRGWIKNHLFPEKMEDLTTIEKKSDVIEIEKKKVAPAPVKQTGDKVEPESHGETPETDEPSEEASEENPDSGTSDEEQASEESENEVQDENTDNH